MYVLIHTHIVYSTILTYCMYSAPIDLACYSTGEKLHSNIMYCNMMLESVVSEPALLSLSTEILAVKGPLPVGEIGKLLAETTSIGNLSQKLKEKFGGLKKFLEKFTNVFVISNDHPFNPNVLLRNSLSPEHLDLIDRGIFPHQLLQKTKKVIIFVILVYVLLLLIVSFCFLTGDHAFSEEEEEQQLHRLHVGAGLQLGQRPGLSRQPLHRPAAARTGTAAGAGS